jgi:hypothetical protein
VHEGAGRPFYRNRLRVDPGFRLEISYCVDKGIPHEQFLEWDVSSRAKVIAYLLEQAGTCQLCGTAGWEWEENKYAYDVQEVFCPGCYRKEVSGTSGDKLPGTRIDLVPATKELRDQQYLLHMRRSHMLQSEDDDE